VHPHELLSVTRGIQRGVDALTAVLLVVVVWQGFAEGSGARRWAALGLALGFAAAYAAGRTRRPSHIVVWFVALEVLWVGMLLVSPAALWIAFPLMLVQMHVLGAHRGIPAVIATTAFAVVAAVAARPSEAFGAVMGPLVGAAVAIAAVTGFHVLEREVRVRQEMLDELAFAREHLAAAERDRIRMVERERLAREIHDTIAQDLSAIGLLLNAAETGVGADDGRMSALVAQARSAVAGSLEQARRVVYELTPPELSDGTLASALRRAATRAAEAAQERGAPLVVSVDVDPHLPALPVPVEIAVLRIAQSALANAVQHAHAKQVNLVAALREGCVVLDVVDDGSGFDPARLDGRRQDRGFGLAVMRSRVAEIGGELVVESSPGEGTAVSVSIPVGVPGMAFSQRTSP
jgi:signal transduction histidine kinase